MMIELTVEERHEAASMRYVDAARVVWLPPGPDREYGKYVVYSMSRGTVIGTAVDCTESTMAELGPLVQHACRVSGEYWALARAEELAERNKEPIVIGRTAGELGL